MSKLTCKYGVDNVLRDMCTFDRESNVDADDCSEFGDCFFKKHADGFYHRVS